MCLQIYSFGWIEEGGLLEAGQICYVDVFSVQILV
jgi:hypothetical protein